MTKKVYQEIASLLIARKNCERSNNQEWYQEHTDRIEAIVKEYMPSGSGIDAGTKLDFDKSTPDKLVFITSYHHMNETGYYDGYTDHTVVITPSLSNEIAIKITGRDRNDIKEYLHETFYYSLCQPVEDLE